MAQDFDFKKAMENELHKAAAKVSLEKMKENLQAYAMASEGLALVMKTWYDGFVKAGFDSMQSMYLTSNMGSTMFLSALSQGGADGDKPKGR
jgi:hypothetical protein